MIDPLADPLSHFDYDVFISYGWSGLEGEDIGDRGWVKSFKQALCADLSAELCRKARIYLDIEASKEGSLPENLEDAVRSSVVFVFVITPSSWQSHWCAQELESFLNVAGVPRESLPIFAIKIRNVTEPESKGERRQKEKREPRDWVTDVVPRSFLTEGVEPDQMDPPKAENPWTESGRRVHSLVIDIVKKMNAASRSMARTVFLAVPNAGSSALERVAWRIEKENVTQGRTIVKGDLSGELGQDCRRRILRQLYRSASSVHFVDAADSIERIQLDAAFKRFGKVEDLGITIYHAGDPASVRLAPASKAQIIPAELGTEYLTSEMEQRIGGRIALSNHFFQSFRSSQGPFVFVHCIETDRPKVRRLSKRLGVPVHSRLFQGDESVCAKIDEEFLNRCDGAGVYFGSQSEFEAYVACHELSQKLSQRPQLPKYVFLDPCSGTEREDFFYPDFQNVPCDD
jgi:hypothetical protein